MKPSRILEIPRTECILEAPGEVEITSAFTSDLLSDVMGNAADDSVLITIQAHQNTIAVASLVGICAILACSSRPIPSDMLEAARKQNIAIFRTPLNQFEASVAIHSLLNTPKP